MAGFTKNDSNNGSEFNFENMFSEMNFDMFQNLNEFFGQNSFK
jgi:hypothetical protein